MRVGPLRHRVTIEQLTHVNHDDGSVVKTWSNVSTVWASIRPLRGQEFFEAQQMKASADHKVILRYQPGILPQSHRFVFGSRTFNIVSVRNAEERNVMLECLCREEP